MANDIGPLPGRGSAGLTPAPRDAAVAVIGRCNLRYMYCFYADEMAAHRDLPAQRRLALFEQGASNRNYRWLVANQQLTRPASTRAAAG